MVGRGGDRLVVDWGEIFFKKIVSQFHHIYTGIDSPVLAGAGAGAWCLTAWLIRLGEGAGTGAGKEDGIKRWEANVSTGAKIDPFKLSMRTPQTPSYLRLGERAGNIFHTSTTRATKMWDITVLLAKNSLHGGLLSLF